MLDIVGKPDKHVSLKFQLRVTIRHKFLNQGCGKKLEDPERNNVFSKTSESILPSIIVHFSQVKFLDSLISIVIIQQDHRPLGAHIWCNSPVKPIPGANERLCCNYIKHECRNRVNTQSTHAKLA